MANEHRIAGGSITQLADRIVEESKYEGRIDSSAITWVTSALIGWSASGSIEGASGQGYIRTGVRFQVKEGNLFECDETIAYLLNREIWNMEWQEVSKDIRTWLTTPKGGMSVTEANIALAHIANWEAQRDNQKWDLFNNFKYDDGVEGSGGVALTGSALKVAQKIMKGVQSYSIWVPVVKRTTTWLYKPEIPREIGAISTPVSRPGWSGFNNEIMDFSGLATNWLKNVERTSSNSDGTFTLEEGWLGVDEIDPDLYSGATGSAS